MHEIQVLSELRERSVLRQAFDDVVHEPLPVDLLVLLLQLKAGENKSAPLCSHPSARH